LPGNRAMTGLTGATPTDVPKVGLTWGTNGDQP